MLASTVAREGLHTRWVSGERTCLVWHEGNFFYIFLVVLAAFGKCVNAKMSQWSLEVRMECVAD